MRMGRPIRVWDEIRIWYGTYFRYVYMQGVLTGARAYFIMQQNS